MKNQDQQLTAVVRGIKRALKEDHGVTVAHSALRSSYLKAVGANPHAFRQASSVADGADHGAPKGAVDKTGAFSQRPWGLPSLPHPAAGAVLDSSHPAVTGLLKTNSPFAIRRLHLVEDDAGCMERLSLDAAGNFPVPTSFEFQPSAELVSQKVRMPSIKRYGIPPYLQEPDLFYGVRFSLTKAKSYSEKVESTGDDSGDTCELQVRMADKEWHRLVLAVVEDSPGLGDTLAEWAGLHYGVNYAALSDGHKTAWALRYMEQFEISESDAPLVAAKDLVAPVTLGWVYPDEDGDSVEAQVNLSTGVVKALGEVPTDIGHACVRVRIESECFAEDILTVYRTKSSDLTEWQVDADDIEELRSCLEAVATVRSA